MHEASKKVTQYCLWIDLKIYGLTCNAGERKYGQRTP